MSQYLLQLSINNDYHLGIFVLLQICFLSGSHQASLQILAYFCILFYPNPNLLCKIFADFFQGFLDVFSIDLHDFRALLNEIFLPIIKNGNYKKRVVTWSVFTGVFIITCFWNWNNQFVSTNVSRTKNWAFMGFFSVIKMTVIKGP